MPGQDGSHNYKGAIKMHLPDQPTSSSEGPAPAGGVGPSGENNNVPDLAAFTDAHGHARSGDPYSPSTPGHLGKGAWTNQSEHSYDPGQPALHSRVTANDNNTYAWPDAPGGGLGNHPDGYER